MSHIQIISFSLHLVYSIIFFYKDQTSATMTITDDALSIIKVSVDPLFIAIAIAILILLLTQVILAD